MLEILGYLLFAWLLLIGGGLVAVFLPIIVFIVVGYLLNKVLVLMERIK